jgi:hypothetical protein
VKKIYIYNIVPCVTYIYTYIYIYIYIYIVLYCMMAKYDIIYKLMNLYFRYFAIKMKIYQRNNWLCSSILKLFLGAEKYG